MDCKEGQLPAMVQIIMKESSFYGALHYRNATERSTYQTFANHSDSSSI